MDKADFTFLITSFCYLVLRFACRIGYLPMEVLDVADIVLWGVLMITTFVKSSAYLMHASRVNSILASILTVIIFILSIVTSIINLQKCV